MLPSIRKFFKSISLCGLFSLFPLLPISAQDIADQHPLPDSIGSKMKYNASIEMKKGYLSGICMLIRDKDGYKGSIFNEFGISVLDFTYQPVTGKVKLENVIQLLDKWYIKRLLKQDLSQVIKNLQNGISIYDNKKYKIHYQFTEMEETIEEARDLSVLACLVLSKELHYKVKMMIGLVAHDLYSRESSVSYQQRLSFDVLMSAIDWPVSFKEITLFAPSK